MRAGKCDDECLGAGRALGDLSVGVGRVHRLTAVFHQVNAQLRDSQPHSLGQTV